MLRLYDFACYECGQQREALVEVPRGEKPHAMYALACARCGRELQHDRLLSPPAMYLGEKPLTPRVHGGSFDTMGNKKPPQLPEFPDGGSFGDFRDFVNAKPYKEVKRERAKVMRENKAKRQRAEAAKRDPNLSFRHNRLPGDPSYR